MNNGQFEVWHRSEAGIFYKWPYYNIGVQLSPEKVWIDMASEFEKLLSDRECAGKVLATIIDQGSRAGVKVDLHVFNVDAAVQGLSYRHPLKAAINSLERDRFISSSNVPTASYSEASLRSIFRW